MENTSENKTINAFCDCCDNDARGTKQQLENNGWGFAKGAEFCPDCN